MNQEDILSNYIEKILNIHDEALTEEDLREIAFEQGLDEAAFMELQEVYKAHMLRGKAFLKHGNSEEAISEFQQALAINPLKPEGLLIQSEAYEKRWRETGKEAFKQEAVFYARRTLKYDPDNPKAIEAIGRIQEAKGIKGPHAKFWILTLSIFLLGGLFITFRAFKDEAGDSGAKTQELLKQESEGEKLSGDAAVFFSNLEVPIRFEKQGTHELELIPATSTFKARKIDHTYHLQGWFKVVEGEIKTVVVEIKMLLTDGTSHLVKELNVFNKGSLPARAGDKIPFGSIIFQDKANPDNIKEVQVLIHELGKVQAPESYEAAIPVEVNWQKDNPKNIQLATRERIYELKTAGSFPHALISLEGYNSGKVLINVLEYQIEWLDNEGKVLHSGNQFLVSSYAPAIAPGETYISSRTYSLAKVPWEKIVSYRVNILRAW